MFCRWNASKSRDNGTRTTDRCGSAGKAVPSLPEHTHSAMAICTFGPFHSFGGWQPPLAGNGSSSIPSPSPVLCIFCFFLVRAFCPVSRDAVSVPRISVSSLCWKQRQTGTGYTGWISKQHPERKNRGSLFPVHQLLTFCPGRLGPNLTDFTFRSASAEIIFSLPTYQPVHAHGVE